MERALGVSKKQLEKVFLVEDCLVVLDGGADLLLENPYDFFGRLLLEVRERAWKDVQQVNAAGRRGLSRWERGVGATGVTKMLDR